MSIEHKEALRVAINTPDHEKRKRSGLFESSRKQLIERDKTCFICGADAVAAGHPLEAHHHPIEWSLTNLMDWQRFSEDCLSGRWGEHAKAFDWAVFFANAKEEPFSYTHDETGAVIQASRLLPVDPYLFVDDMRVNGLLLCKAHHTESNEGMHDLPFPIWIAQRYAYAGYQFAKSVQIHHGGLNEPSC